MTSKCQSVVAVIRLFIVHIDIVNLATLDIDGIGAAAFVGTLKETPNE